MSELAFDERMNTLESLIVKIYNNAGELRTQDELEAVRKLIFDDGITNLENRLIAIKNNLEMVRKIIDTANG
jgi:hypothetical protein